MGTQVNYAGHTYTLQQDAYADNYGTDGAVRYYAHATDNDGNDYIVMWSPSPAWEAAQQEARESNDWSDYPAILDDEGNACDWDNPVDVIPA
jgi:hypothetical protein